MSYTLKKKKDIIKYLSLFLSLLLSNIAWSQIVSLDTVCVNTPVLFKTPYSAITYSWIFDTVNINQSPGAYSTVLSGSPLGINGFVVMCNDGGNYYAFTAVYSTNVIQRLDFGTNPNSTPTVTNLGSFGLTNGMTQGIDIVKDSVTNTWYGLAIGGSELLFLNFGPSLSNPSPTSSITTFSNLIYWPHQLTIKKSGNNWLAFVADRNGWVSRLDFSTSLTNTPTLTHLPMVGGIQNPCNFSLYFDNGNWYMFVTDLISANITRLDFGANLMNNSPAGTNLGNPGGVLHLPRSFNFIRGCGGFLAYVFNESGEQFQLDFQNNILNTSPVVTSLGNNINTNTNGGYPYVYGNQYYWLINEFYANAIIRQQVLTLPTPNLSYYYTDSTFHTFTATGTYNITLFCDQANDKGPRTFCKQITVIGAGTGKTKDTSLCGENVITLSDPSGWGPYLWSNGDTSSSITVATSGNYTVLIGSGSCAYTDTFKVAIGTIPVVNLGNDTTICAAQPLVLASSGSFPNATYLWNTSATSPSITVNQAGSYSLTITEGECSGSDSVQVSFRPVPQLNLGNDTAVCHPVSLTLLASQPVGTIYKWNTGSTADSIAVTSAGRYWLSISDSGCTASDTILVSEIYKPAVQMSDTIPCFGDIITLPQYPDISCYHCSYLWSDGSKGTSLEITKSGTYIVTVSNLCGAITDTMKADYQPCNIWFPNAFTPNDDGKNDIARVVGALKDIDNFSLYIFNRWGQEVFMTHDKYAGWDGVFNGTPQPIGTFNYMIKYTFRGQSHLLKGTLELVR